MQPQLLFLVQYHRFLESLPLLLVLFPLFLSLLHFFLLLHLPEVGQVFLGVVDFSQRQLVDLLDLRG